VAWLVSYTPPTLPQVPSPSPIPKSLYSVPNIYIYLTNYLTLLAFKRGGGGVGRIKKGEIKGGKELSPFFFRGLSETNDWRMENGRKEGLLNYDHVSIQGGVPDLPLNLSYANCTR